MAEFLNNVQLNRCDMDVSIGFEEAFCIAPPVSAELSTNKQLTSVVLLLKKL